MFYHSQLTMTIGVAIRGNKRATPLKFRINGRILENWSSILIVKKLKVQSSNLYDNKCMTTSKCSHSWLFYNPGHISRIFMFDEIFLSPQVKRILIISNNHGIYELPQELTNDLKLKKLRKINKKISKLDRL